jgi:hypothetical protein
MTGVAGVHYFVIPAKRSASRNPVCRGSYSPLVPVSPKPAEDEHDDEYDLEALLTSARLEIGSPRFPHELCATECPKLGL